MNRTSLVLTALLAGAGCTQEPTAPEPVVVHDAQPRTVSLQCGSMWKNSPQMRAYYDETAATLLTRRVLEFLARVG